MKEPNTIWKCAECGIVFEALQPCEKGDDCIPACCGRGMTRMLENRSDGAGEKHVPVLEREGQTVTVKVGSVAHPMLEAHSIRWIALETKEGMQRKQLQPGEEPKASFALTEGDEPVAAYEYCNLHGLWKAEA